MRRSHRLLAYSISALVLATPMTRAGDVSSGDIRKTISAVRPPEVPREVARLVSAAKSLNGRDTCDQIIRTAVELNPTSAAAIVGAAAKAWPEEAPKFSATAARLEPKLAPAIAKAAASSAPAFASEIAVAVIKQLPAQYAKVASAVSLAVPEKNQEIVNAVVAGFPSLKQFVPETTLQTPAVTIADLIATTGPVEKASHELGMSTEQFLAADLTSAQKATVTTKVLSGAGFQANVRPPFVPGGGTPGEIKRSQTVEVVPGGGRDYSKP